MSEFEKWWKQYEDDKDICYNSDIGLDAVKSAFAAGQAASAARIAELEADCKVMAESQVKSHLCTYGDTPESCLLGIGESCNYNNRFIDGCPAYGNCACPACVIADKYREA